MVDRCTATREAHRLERKQRREGRRPPALVDATGTARRIQGLVAAGHSYVDIGRHTGWRGDYVHRLATVRRRTVTVATAARVRQITHELAHRTGTSRVARTVASRRGWVSIYAWDDIDNPDERPHAATDEPPLPAGYVDPVAVQLAIAGQLRRPATWHEKLAAFRQLRRCGVPPYAIQRRLRMSGQQTAQAIAAVESTGVVMANAT